MTDPARLIGQAEALKSARKAARMSQRHLAEAAGVSDRTVRRAESGYPITGEVALALCAVLGLLPSQLAEPEVAGGPHAPPGHPRPMPDYELDTRLFAYALFRWVGGIHPLMLIVFAPLLHLTYYTLAGLAGAVLTLYAFSRRCGATHRQALEFLRGQRFADGEPVELLKRKQAYIDARTDPPPSPA